MSETINETLLGRSRRSSTVLDLQEATDQKEYQTYLMEQIVVRGS